MPIGTCVEELAGAMEPDLGWFFKAWSGGLTCSGLADSRAGQTWGSV